MTGKLKLFHMSNQNSLRMERETTAVWMPHHIYSQAKDDWPYVEADEEGIFASRKSSTKDTWGPL